MSESEYVFTVFKKYWKILTKWLLRIHNLPEITVDELFDRMNSNQPPKYSNILSALHGKSYHD